MRSSREIREQFLHFFKEKQHQIVPSAPIVVKNDPTLMFTNAGMNQFKDSFLGLKKPAHRRVADTQKCLRVSGKHNDLEEVGHDTYHHTMFEMLGNWSFGDYYKEEAIDWAWELLTKVYQLPEDRLYASIFGGDQAGGLPEDTEAAKLWEKYLPEERILRYGKKDNFWEMGEVGPCGPCSEIHVDLRSDEERARIPGKKLVNADDPNVVEIWNLVFIQFNAKADGTLEELPEKHIDTGMGFERLVMALQRKASTYDTDLFDLTRGFIEAKTQLTYETATPEQQVAIRVIIDHIRAIVFAIGDGQIPSNTGAGYVIRRILRRASRYGYSYLGLDMPFLHEMVDLLAEEYEGVFEEVSRQRAFIARIIHEEEKGFLRKLESGTQMFEEYLAEHPKQQQVDGEFAFKLYDTFGFPIDLTQLMAREHGREVDMDAFSQHLTQQKERSRAATEKSAGDWVIVHAGQDLPRFVGYDLLEIETRIRQYRTVKTAKKQVFQVVLEETPFYAESGGQIGDRGVIKTGPMILKVLDTQKENELIVHIVDKLPDDTTGTWTAKVDADFRQRVRINHSATHLLHAALRNTLGTHVEQRGSLVSHKGLRFDFSHFAKVTEEELEKIEQEINVHIAAAIPLTEYRGMPIEEAKQMGAMALFGEKYGEEVRVIVFDPDYSVELCGGTHVQNTSEIRLLKISSEGSVAAGIRRIECLTAEGALDHFHKQLKILDRVSQHLKSSKPADEAVADLITSHKSLEKELQTLQGEKVQQLKADLLNKVYEKDGLNLIREQVMLSSSEDLKQLSYDLRNATQNTLIVLGAVVKDKPLLSVILSEDLAAQNKYHAGELVRTLAREIKGGGGGQPFYATAGGKDVGGLKNALAKIEELV